ncbi:MAG: triose-phosphate isomerase [Firmicutes bacterium]|nr:triose-phosphate isomerase [Bacillota bacterium]
MKIIAGNWKMNGTPAENKQRLLDIKASADTSENCVIVIPPFLSLTDAVEILADTQIWVGAQNCYPKASGAFTGEVSAAMLKDIGCTYCLVGHSERRQYFHEDSAYLKEKIVALMELDMIPIFCVGESLEQREDGSWKDVIAAQIEEVLCGMDIDKERIVLGYEPVWAIGTGKTATPEDADETMGFIREVLKKNELPTDLMILYGGSAKPSNAEDLLAKENVDGLLIGGASLIPDDFAAMTKMGNK